MGCLSGCLMSSASIQNLCCGICSAFKCSFDEFVGEKVVSLSYSSTILGPPPTPTQTFKIQLKSHSLPKSSQSHATDFILSWHGSLLTTICLTINHADRSSCIIVSIWSICVCVCVCVCARSVMSDSLQPASLLCPWDFPGKNNWSGLPCLCLSSTQALDSIPSTFRIVSSFPIQVSIIAKKI